MFNLIDTTLFFASYGNIANITNITISPMDIALAYIVTIIVSIVVAYALRIPLLPSKPYRYSFDVSAIYPTPIIAMGIFSIFLVLNYTFMYNGLVLAIVIGILSALFVKYLFDFVFPKPLSEDEGDVIDE
ncbi:MAG: energy-converting hydrogenase A subunit A EhaA [Methanobrevibacter sp.]|uniref:energy-converting NiFe hydrogenase A subunit EhaA n=1 Tax=Methanobrevibacter TaxID=2172 RepID=UPI0015BD2DC6|nr:MULTISPECIES: energy-converting NiFe hydrogenase A subunit EhaA [Methanobrevibacter]MCI7428697.1 energy-converting hydrogenase A subunit A EhaA [Methanobrevibacter sp.]MDD6777379.1 energy-converting NiFe hydrogenase A subunit EhaA [Methanobacteriaceae archaeon]MDY3096984.1 energy-converting NiFe hydrogenase A subunit EhaA [Methanobrevibacter sp.]